MTRDKGGVGALTQARRDALAVVTKAKTQGRKQPKSTKRSIIRCCTPCAALGTAFVHLTNLLRSSTFWLALVYMALFGATLK